MSKMNDLEEWTKLGPGRLVVVAKDTDPETAEGIRDSIERTAKTCQTDNIQHLLKQGWFVSMNDKSVTIDIKGKEESFLLEQIVVCLGLDVLQEWLDARSKREEEENN